MITTSGMRCLILGPPQCGKSVLAEQLLSTVGKEILYIGTLPALPKYKERLYKHQARRDKRWRLLEAGCEWGYFVEKIWRETRQIEYVLLDGLTMLIWFYVCSKDSVDEQLYLVLKADLIALLGGYTKNWVVVDAVQSDRSSVLGQMGSDLQSSIRRLSNNVIVVDRPPTTE
jgi:adenosyl cobinamide kinase/adenosyl cobinamide phosphate guanylyltransferase